MRVIQKWVSLFLFLLLVTSIEARAEGYYQNYSNYCCEDRCFEWGVYGDWIYWNTRRCQLDYAVPSDGAGGSIGSVFQIEPTYESGFRVGLFGECGCFVFDLFYTYYHPQRSDTTITAAGAQEATRADPDLSGVASPEFSRARWWLDYDVVDLLAGYELCNRNCFRSYFLGGLKLAFIDQKLDSLYAATPALSGLASNTVQKIDMDAYGVNIGFGGNYRLCSCLNFFGRASYDVLLANTKRTYLYSNTSTGVQNLVTQVDQDDRCWVMAGVYNLSFGIGYDYLFTNCWCTHLGISLGYEFHKWNNVLDFFEYQGINGVVSLDRHLQSLGFDGLFIRLALGF